MKVPATATIRRWVDRSLLLVPQPGPARRAVRLPEGDLVKSAVSRRFVALSRKKMKAWLASDSELDLPESSRSRYVAISSSFVVVQLPSLLLESMARKAIQIQAPGPKGSAIASVKKAGSL